MFFPERIKSIRDTDKVLEIGPGATPYFRSDVFLEKKYDTEKELIAQSGHVGLLKTDKRQVIYKGDIFPFADKEFDYVICSHVLEHVDNADIFLRELQRVANKGYIEFPTLYYDYIYNFPEHKLLLLYKEGVINWMTKEESGMPTFSSIQKFYYKTIELGYSDMVNDCKKYYFQGFEWFDKIKSIKVNNVELLTYSDEDINLPPKKEMITIINYANISLKEHIKFKIRKLFKMNIKKLIKKIIGNKSVSLYR